MSSSVVSPMAETTTTTGRPLAAVRETRTAAARIRSAVASEVPPYFWTISPGWSGNDVGPSIARRQVQGHAGEPELLRGRVEGGGDRVDLLGIGAQSQHRGTRARRKGAQRACLHRRVQKPRAGWKEWQSIGLMQAIPGRFAEHV